MGKKYIIELLDDCQSEFKGILTFGVTQEKQISIELIPEEDLTPYTEPDLEQVRKEAYKEGREAGIKDGKCEAWEAAKKISLAKIDGGFSWESMNNMFGTDSPSKIYKTFTASEAIEKIRQYEQEQENEFKVGDEFENEKSGKKFVVLKMNGKEIDRYIDADGKTYCMTVKYKEKRKTGRHFPEIAEILEKMREDGSQNRIQETMSDDY